MACGYETPGGCPALARMAERTLGRRRSVGMIVYEKTSKMVKLGLGPPDPGFMPRAENRTSCGSRRS